MCGMLCLLLLLPRDVVQDTVVISNNNVRNELVYYSSEGSSKICDSDRPVRAYVCRFRHTYVITMRSDTSETCYVVARQKILSIVCTVPALSVTFSP